MLFLCEILFFKPKRPSVVSCDIYNLRIIQEYFQPKIGRKIRILSLGRKNNILIKKRVYLNLCATEMGAFVFSLHACIVERKKDFRPVGLHFRPVGLCFRPVDLRFRPAGLRFKPQGLRFRPVGLRFRPVGLRFRP